MVRKSYLRRLVFPHSKQDNFPNRRSPRSPHPEIPNEILAPPSKFPLVCFQGNPFYRLMLYLARNRPSCPEFSRILDSDFLKLPVFASAITSCGSHCLGGLKLHTLPALQRPDSNRKCHAPLNSIQHSYRYAAPRNAPMIVQVANHLQHY